MSARVFVPGRIEVLGKHTDYAGGSSLLIAAERGFTFQAEPLAGDRIVFVRDDSTGFRTAAELDSQPDAAGTIGRRPRDSGAAGTVEGGSMPRRESDVGRVHEVAAYRIDRRGDIVTAVPDEVENRPGWARYVDGVLQRTLGTFQAAACGASIRFRSDLPVAAGLSSSSALVCGIFLALDAVCRFSALPVFRRTLPGRQALAGWLSAAEMGGPVGTRGGSEDHVAILCAEQGRIVRYRLAPIRYRGAAAVPEGWTFAVGVSGVAADKGGPVQAHFNRLSDLAARAAEAWVAGTGNGPGAAQPAGAHDRPGIDGAASSGDGGAADSRRTALNLGDALELAGDADGLLAGIRGGAAALGEEAGPLLRRARHFLEECALVDAAFDALIRGDVAAFAAAANRSAAVGADMLDNQVPETLRLAELARDLGAAAASPFGAGFGGAVWALVRDADAAAFLDEWRTHYRAAFPGRPGAEFFLTLAAGPAAKREDS